MFLVSLHPGATEILHASPAEVIKRSRPLQLFRGDALCARVGAEAWGHIVRRYSNMRELVEDHLLVATRQEVERPSTCKEALFCTLLLQGTLVVWQDRQRSQTFTVEQLGFHIGVCRFVSTTLSSRRTAYDSTCAISSHVPRTEDGCTCFPGATP